MLSLMLIAACAQPSSDGPHVSAQEAGIASELQQTANEPPEAPLLQVTPTDAIAGIDDLTCAIISEATDPDDDTTSTVMFWTVDGEPVDVEGDTVDAAELTVGQVWVCAVVVSDGEHEVEALSDPVEIQSWMDEDLWVEPMVSITPDPLMPGEPAFIHYRGDLSTADSLTMVYGFNGWSDLDDGSDYSREDLHETVEYYYLEAEMEKVDGGFQVEVELPEQARSLHVKFESGDQQDDGNGREYHASAVFPYIGPYLTWSDDAQPSNGIVVSWETRAESLGAVAWGVDEPRNIEMGQVSDTLHHVTLTGLEPDTTYVYQVLDSNGQASEVYSFTTAPADATSFRFVVAADMQEAPNGNSRWDDVAEAILEEDPAFVYMPGDLAADDRPGFWWLFFDSGRELFANVPSVPILGNHDTPGIQSDTDSSSFQRYYVLPESSGSENYYTIEYGNSLFLALSTEHEKTLREGNAQWTWIQETLASTWDGDERLYDWVFAGYHHPSYDIGSRFGHESEAWRSFTELFDFNVDWVFMAHEHMYQRFSPLTYDSLLADDYGVGPLDGVGYMVVPSAGSYLFNKIDLSNGPNAYQRELLAWPVLDDSDEQAETQHGYVRVDIDGTLMTMTTLGMGTQTAPVEPGAVDTVELTSD